MEFDGSKETEPHRAQRRRNLVHTKLKAPWCSDKREDDCGLLSRRCEELYIDKENKWSSGNMGKEHKQAILQ